MSHGSTTGSPAPPRPPGWRPPVDDAVRDLARAAGVATDWVDAADQPQRVGIATLRQILAALGYPCTTAADIAESREWLRGAGTGPRAFMTATVGAPLRLPEGDNAELLREDGTTVSLRDGAPLDTPGYHRLLVVDREIALAVAPKRCMT